MTASLGAMNHAGIYMIECVRDGARPLFYVGQSSNLAARRRAHWSALRCGYHGNGYMQAAWRKYGEAAFSFVVVKLVPKAELDREEQAALDAAFAIDGCMNILPSARSTRGFTMPAETRRKIAAANRGKVVSEETRRRQSAAKAGLAPMAATAAAARKCRKPVIGTCMSTGVERFYEGGRSAAADGFTPVAILYCCKGRSKSHSGHIWRYA